MSDIEIPQSLPEAQAASLAEAALLLDRARQERNPADLALALDRNLSVWAVVRTVAVRPDVTLTAVARGNLLRLAEYVSTTTLTGGVAIDDRALDTLININLQISEGLLEGAGLIPHP